MLLTSRRLNAIPEVVHGFSTRSGGCSTGPLESLNLAWDRGSLAQSSENWNRLRRAVNLEGAAVGVVHQVHGDRVWHAQPEGSPLEPQADADAVFTLRAGELVAVRTADCVPILLAGPGVVVAVHAGWRGTAKGIVLRAVETICNAASCQPDQLTAAIGPCISGAAYEVGQEVVEGISERVDPARFVRRSSGRLFVDLKAANGALLEKAGVLDVDILPHCTHSDSAFFSHRRDGSLTGRMASVIGFRAT